MKPSAHFIENIPELRVFLEQVSVEVIGGKRKPVKNWGKGYRADEKRLLADGREVDLREFAGFGASRICDYFRPAGEPDDEVMHVIEDSNLKAKEQTLRNRHDEEAMQALLRQKYRLKAYGSMLILHRLFLGSVSDADAPRKLLNMPCRFWLVVNDIPPKDALAFGWLSSSLRSGLEGLYSKGVAVLGIEMFEGQGKALFKRGR